MNKEFIDKIENGIVAYSSTLGVSNNINCVASELLKFISGSDLFGRRKDSTIAKGLLYLASLICRDVITQETFARITPQCSSCSIRNMYQIVVDMLVENPKFHNSLLKKYKVVV